MIGGRVPDAARAVVTEGKVRDYLLAAEHPDNGGKAGFFARFGFSRVRWRDRGLADWRRHPGPCSMQPVQPGRSQSVHYNRLGA
jgi:hypothetical protein